MNNVNKKVNKNNNNIINKNEELIKVIIIMKNYVKIINSKITKMLKFVLLNI